MKLHERKLKHTEKEQNNLQQYLHVYKVPKWQNKSSDDSIKKFHEIFSEKVGVATVQARHWSGPQIRSRLWLILVWFYNREKQDENLSSRHRLTGKGVVG